MGRWGRLRYAQASLDLEPTTPSVCPLLPAFRHRICSVPTMRVALSWAVGTQKPAHDQ